MFYDRNNPDLMASSRARDPNVSSKSLLTIYTWIGKYRFPFEPPDATDYRWPKMF
jgi:hypothetical protein